MTKTQGTKAGDAGHLRSRHRTLVFVSRILVIGISRYAAAFAGGAAAAVAEGFARLRFISHSSTGLAMNSEE